MSEESAAFDSVAGLYRRGRRSYPPELVDWLHAECAEARRVVDLGCGPGTLTVPLARRFADVIGVDPSRTMLAELRRGVATPAVAARGEELPFADTSLDLVVASQSFHWMDCVAVTAELRRVLRPGGGFVSCWQRWMDPQSPVERLWRQGWRECRGCEPPRDPARPKMEDVELALGAPDASFDSDQAWPLDAEGIVAFFVSRAPCGTVAPEARAELAGYWADGAAAVAPFEYTLRIGARVWRRERLEARQGRG